MTKKKEISIEEIEAKDVQEVTFEVKVFEYTVIKPFTKEKLLQIGEKIKLEYNENTNYLINNKYIK